MAKFEVQGTKADGTQMKFTEATQEDAEMMADVHDLTAFTITEVE